MPKPKKNTTVIHVELSNESLTKLHKDLDALHAKIRLIKKDLSALAAGIERASNYSKGSVNAG